MMIAALIAAVVTDGILDFMGYHPFRPFFALGLLALLTLGGACKDKEPVPVGFGIFEIGKSTPKDGYVCVPQGKQTYCSNNPSPSIANHKTETSLYFNGLSDDAPLAEILVSVWSCKPGPVSADLQAKMGEPTQVTDKRAMWKMKRMTVIALLPMESGLCTVHFLDHGETARIAELFPPAAAAK